ncbi:PLP-dependent aminotransferase family protein [Methylobacterium platani]|uniref:8-amino-7-oxononanoate synthase n=2 Tax=Methylobacterium platani TaxID=427683 RepID=A0A179SEV9_9HYPH|nr:PLP-dependent aminotransferase family protein [Methylobacterium platani]KMO10052.1 aminotransferase [Methylobacterium platani JCM 14648]OAS25502.1 aminotransferase [Methylobacterium platani]
MVPSPPPPAAATRPAFARWMGTTNQVTRTFLSAGAIPGLINLGGGLPDPSIFPTGRLAEFARRAVAEHPGEALGYGPIEGLAPLRDAVARRFSSPALPLTRANVLVTTSGMQGLDLLGKVLLDEGGLIAGQYPTYLGALDAWRPRAPSFRNLMLAAPGFDAEAALAGAQFAYAVPNFSNPTGRLVDLETRRALVAAAHRTGTWLVEDDPYGTLHYDGAPLPRLIDVSAQAAPGESYAGPVIYMGTLSKEIAPGLRIGWIVAAPAMIEALTLAKQGSDLCTSGVTQRVALSAIETGLVDEIRPALVALYRERRDALCAALGAHLSEWFDWEVPVGGMFVWALAKDPGFDTDALLTHALAAGICFSPSSVFDATGTNRRGMRLNFTLNPPERLDEGMRRLGLAVAAYRHGRDGA